MDAVMADRKAKDRAVKIDEDIALKALTMCSYRKQSMTKYLSELLRPFIEKDFAAFSQELADNLAKEKQAKDKRRS